MLRKARIVGISAAMAACVLGATAGFSEDTPPPRLRGTLDQVNGNTLTIKTRSGAPTTVQLKDGSPVIATVKGSMSDIQDNSFVGITAMAQPDGAIKAVEVPSLAGNVCSSASSSSPSRWTSAREDNLCVLCSIDMTCKTFFNSI